MTKAAQLRAAVRRLTAVVAVQSFPKDLYQMAAHEARRLTGGASSAVCFLTPSRDMLDYAAASGVNAESIAGLRIRVTDSLSEAVVNSGLPLLIDADSSATGNLFTDFPDAQFEFAQNGGSDPFTSDGSQGAVLLNSTSRSAVIVPILQDGSVIGTIAALNRSGSGDSVNQFDSDDTDTLEMIAEIVALGRISSVNAVVQREQSREITVLCDAAQNISVSLNIAEVMENALSAVCNHLEHHSASLYLLNDERTHLFIAAERNLADNERDMQLHALSGVHSSVLTTGTPILLEDLDPGIEEVTGSSNARSAMIAPLQCRDEMFGIIVICSSHRNAYRSEDLNLLNTVATQAGIAIDNAFLYDSAQRQSREASALLDLSQRVNSTLQLGLSLEFVADSVMNLLQVDKIAIQLIDAATGLLVSCVVRNLDIDSFVKSQNSIAKGIGGWVYTWQSPQAVSDIAADARNITAPLDAFGVASTLCVPLQAGDAVLGVIHAMSEQRRLFTVSEMELLYTVANLTAAAIMNANEYTAVRNAASGGSGEV